MGYDAFLSYSHAADGRLAPALQSGLHRFAKSWRQRRALHVFRDKTGLSANPGLWSSIQEVLNDTRYFVLLASPEAAQSPWVDREIEYWREHKPPNTILPVLTDGELVWDDATNDFDRTRSTAAPAALYGAFSEEPLWADLRWARSEEDLSLRHARFRDALAELAAPMHGRPKDELEGEDVRQQRRTRRLVRGAVGVLAVLTVAAVAASVFAVRNAERAEDRRKLAVSRQLAGQAEANADDDLQQSLLLAGEAYRIAPTVEAEGAVFGTGNEATELQAVAPLHDLDVPDLVLVPDRDLLISAGTEGSIVYWDTKTHEEIERLEDVQPGVVALTHDADFATVASVSLKGDVVIWDLGDPGVADEFRLERRGQIFDAALSPDGGTLATVHKNGLLGLWDAETGAAVSEPVVAHEGAPVGVAWAPDGQALATSGQSPDSSIAIWDRAPEPVERVRYFHSLGHFAAALAFSPDGGTLASGGTDGLVALQDLDAVEPFQSPEIPASAQGHSAVVNDLEFANRNLVVSVGIDGRLLRWDTGTAVTYPDRLRIRPVGLDSVTTSGSLIATGAEDGTVALYDFDAPRVPGEVVEVGAGVQELAVSLGGNLIAVSDSDSAVRFWDTEAGEWRDDEIDLHNRVAWSAAFSPDGAHVALGTNTGAGTIGLYTIDGDLVGTTEQASDEQGVGYAAFSPDGDYVATGGFNSEVTLWQVGDDGLSDPEVISDQFIGGLAFDPDGDEVVFGQITTELSSEVVHYDLGEREVADRQEIDTFVTAIEYDAAGDTIATGETSGAIAIWNADDGRRLGSLVGHAGPVLGLTFIDDGARLVSGSGEGDVRLWDVASRQAVGAELLAHEGDLGAFAGHAASSVVMSGGLQDERMVMWQFVVGPALTQNCELAGRNLTRDEWEQYLPDESYHVTCEEWPPGE
ncbi:MAG: TIR domain-containing protein [Acidimicrobiia bacterium]